MYKIKISILIAVLSVQFCANAQYKKASFLDKDGRTYELGTTLHLLNKGRSAQQGIHLSLGRETSKQFFFWYDLELLLPSKFKTTGIETYSQKVKDISGKSKTSFILRYDFGYFLLKMDEESNKILPFVTAGFNYKIGGGITLDAANANDTYDNFTAPENAGSFGLNAGVGAIAKLNSKFGVKFAGGYNYQFSQSSFKRAVTSGTDYTYNAYISHPYVSVGIRYKIESE